MDQTTLQVSLDKDSNILLLRASLDCCWESKPGMLQTYIASILSFFLGLVIFVLSWSNFEKNSKVFQGFPILRDLFISWILNSSLGLQKALSLCVLKKSWQTGSSSGAIALAYALSQVYGLFSKPRS